MKKFNHFSSIDKILRKNHPEISRFNKIRLDKNERLKDFSKIFLNKFTKKIETKSFTMYPELNSSYFLLAKYLKVKTENLVITAGSDLAIKNCFELIVRKNSEVISLDPTYGMVDVYCKIYEANQHKIKFGKNLKLNVNDILKKINKKISLVIIANPNSPTGTIIEEDDMLKILSKAKKCNSYVLIDECYYDYYGKTYIKFIEKYNNLIVSRSFSKIGLAGCRVGCLISSKKNINRLLKFRPMYEISRLSNEFLNYCLKNKTELKNYFKEIKNSREFFSKELKKLNLQVPKSYGNFQLVNFNNKKTKLKVFNQIRKKNINITEEKTLNENNYLRFTLSTKTTMVLVINMIKKTLRDKK